MRGGVGAGISGSGPQWWLRWSAHPLGGAVCRGHAQYAALLSALLGPTVFFTSSF